MPEPETPLLRTQGWVSLGSSRAAARCARRQRARERIHARVARPIDTPRLLPDPLEHNESALRSTLTVARLLGVAALLHGLILYVAFIASQVLASNDSDRRPERLQVRIVEKTRPPPPPPAPVLEPPPPPRVAAEAPPRVAAEAPRPRREPRPRPAAPQEAPPDPVVPSKPVEAAAPRRVVGLSLESTVQGGQGPAFAVGSTRMGETAPAAVDPRIAVSEPEVKTPNRVSTRFEEPDVPIVAPRRLAAKQPAYPPMLRERGVEADVVVVVSIGTDGRVTKVEIARPAAEQAFNDAALAAAREEVYAPATRGGEPVAFTQRYTVRFRLND